MLPPSNISNNDVYNFKQLKILIENKWYDGNQKYEYDFYYYNGLIKYIILVELKNSLALGVLLFSQKTIKQYIVWLQTIDIWNKCKQNNGKKLWVCFLLWCCADQKTCIIIAYHSLSLDSSENSSNNGACDFKILMCEIYKNETI